MKGKICLHTKLLETPFLRCFFLVLCFMLSLANLQNASAISLQGGYLADFTSGYLKTGNGGNPMQATLSNGNLIWRFGAQSDYITNLSMNLSETTPENSLIFFNVDYKIEATGVSATALNIDYVGLPFSTGTQLWESCTSGAVSYEAISYGTKATYSITCSYLLHTHQGWNQISTIDDHRIAKFTPTYSLSNTEAVIIVSPLSVRQVNWNALSRDDRAWLEEHMPAGSSTADIESAIESAREDEKSEYEDQQEDVDSGADDAGEEAEEATSSLINTGKSIIETIRDTPATNCVIRIKSGAFDTGNMNLCNVPQQIRTVISTIITIPVTLAALHIAYSTVMLYLNTVRKEQE